MRSTRQPITRYRIGAIDMELSSPIPWVLREHAQLYERHVVPISPARAGACVDIQVGRSEFRPWRRRRYVVEAGGRTQFEPAQRRELIPFIEWAMNWEVPRVYPQYLQFHASSIEMDGCGVIFPGASGCGKSTLTTGLVANGARYLCDEFALIHTTTLQLHPYPRAICIKKPSFAAVESVGVPVANYKFHLKGSKGFVAFVSPHEFGATIATQPCPIRFVIFPQYVHGAAPALVPINRAEAAFSLHKFCFNLLGTQRVGLDVIAAIVRGAACYRLTSGDLHNTMALVRGEIEVASKRGARCA